MLERGPRRNHPRLLGNLLLALGVGLLLLAGAAYVTEQTGSDRVLPRPVALAGTGGSAAPVASPTPPEASATPTAVPTPPATAAAPAPAALPPTGTPMATPVPTRTPVPTPTPTPVKPGTPLRIVIPSIEVDSEVREAGTFWQDGELLWETLRWVVAHYRTTAKAGAKGNAVFSGHVTSRDAGNVFRDLYKIQLGDVVQIYTEDAEFTYVVSGVREVLPTDVSVMDPTQDATATLITCSGEWIPARREYTHRLIVTAKLKI